MSRKLKLALTVVLLAFAFAFVTACGGGSSNEPNDPTPTPAPTPATSAEATPQPVATPPPRDLGGIEILIANWWNDDCTETFNYANAGIMDRMVWENRRELEQKHNFRIRNVRVGNWNTARDLFPDLLATGSREYQVMMLEPSWFLALNADGAFAPMSMEHFERFPEVNWQRGHIDLSMRGGSPHGFSTETFTSGGIAFNMRLFEEAGLPGDYLFQLQANNTWTWDNFLRVARQVQQFDAEGNITIWPILGFHADMFELALSSNNADLAGIDPTTGFFVNNTTSTEVFEVLELMVQVREEMLASLEDDFGTDEWNYFIEAFNAGHGAMRPGLSHIIGDISVSDPWGWVAFPRGPSAPWTDGYMGGFNGGNFVAIPHVFSPDEVDDIMFALGLWNSPLPDGDEDDWMIGEFARFHDPRSVTETMAQWTRNPDWLRTRVYRILPGNIQMGETFAWRVWRGPPEGGLWGAAVIVEEAQQVWNENIARANALIGGR
ncbi:MAG: hypothetical protein FWE90_02360 [Defluviitaleaceae bacterium]|nr:hypothetical protein [Defluviitaleaceae bacterium]